MKKFRNLVTATAFLMGTASILHASPSGTVVTNTISLSYTAGGNTIEDPAAATATFSVDRKIDLAVTGLNAGAIVYAERSQDEAILSYRVENLGNDPTGFDINIVDTGALGLTYDPLGAGMAGTWHVVISDNATPGLGIETLYDINGTVNVGDVPPEGAFFVHIYANIRDDAEDLDQRDFEVTATALDAGTNNPTVEVRGEGLNGLNIVFADLGLNGFETAEQSLIILAPDLTAIKTVAVISENLDGAFNCETGAPVAGAEATIPGACVQYTISVTNAPSASMAASDIEIVDALPAQVTFVTLDSGNFDTVTETGGVITGSIASLAPGVTASLTIRATIGN